MNTKTYYAIFDEDDYLHTGKNANSPKDAAKQFLEYKIADCDEDEEQEHRKLLKELGPKGYIESFMYTQLHESKTPFL